MTREITINFTDQNLKSYLAEYWMDEYAKRGEIFVSALFLVALIIFGIIKKAGGSALIVGFLILGFWIIRIMIYVKLKRGFLRRLRELGSGQMVYLFQHDKMELKSVKGVSSIEWTRVFGLRILKNILVIFWTKHDFTVVPLWAVDSELITFLKSKLRLR